MFNKLSMQARLIFAFMFMGLLVLIVALVGLSGSSRLSKHIDTLASNNVPSISGLWKIGEGQTQIESSERGLLATNLNKDGRQAEISRMDTAWKQIQEGFQQYEAASKTAAEKSVYQDFSAKWDKWKQAHEEFLRLNLQFEALGVLNPLSSTAGNAAQSLAAYRKLQDQANANRQPFQDAAAALQKILIINEDLAATTKRTSSNDVSQVGF